MVNRRWKLLMIAITCAMLAAMVVGCPAPSPDIPPEEEGAMPPTPTSTPTPTPTPTPTLNRIVSERLIVEIDLSSWVSEPPTISPDSKRVAYPAGVDNKYFVVVDGVEAKQYDSLGGDSIIFSPDSNRVAYAAQLGDKRFVVVDGVEGKQYDDIGEGSLIFSPDSQRVAYEARQGDKWFIVVDGVEGKQYDNTGVGSLIFSPDSQLVAYAAVLGNKWYMVVDKDEGKEYDVIIMAGGGRIVFDSPNSLHYLAMKGSGVYLVEEEIERGG